METLSELIDTPENNKWRWQLLNVLLMKFYHSPLFQLITWVQPTRLNVKSKLSSSIFAVLKLKYSVYLNFKQWNIPIISTLKHSIYLNLKLWNMWLLLSFWKDKQVINQRFYARNVWSEEIVTFCQNKKPKQNRENKLKSFHLL